MENLTSQLNEVQLKQNIDALQGKGLPNQQVQDYVNKYSKSGDGSYKLKGGFMDNVRNNPFANKVSNAVDTVGNTLGHGFQDAIKGPATLATRVGQAAGVGIAHALPKYFDADKAMQAADSNQEVPGLGVNIKPISEETPESLTGEAASTLAFGAGPTLGGALGAGGAAMQNNEGVGSVALKAGVGGLLGYGLNRAAGAIGKSIHPSMTGIEDDLVRTGATADVEAPQIANTLREMGVKNISDPTQRAIAHNVLDNTIRGVQQRIDSAIPDAISGQLDDGVLILQKNLDNLLSAQRALQQAGSVPIPPPPGPGLMGRIASGVGKGALKTLRNVGYVGLGTLGAAEATDPKSILRRTMSQGGL